MELMKTKIPDLFLSASGSFRSEKLEVRTSMIDNGSWGSVIDGPNRPIERRIRAVRVEDDTSERRGGTDSSAAAGVRLELRCRKGKRLNGCS